MPRPVRGAKIIGRPYEGTHTLGNWESDNAVDLAVPVGTPIYAVAGGTIGKQFGKLTEGGGRFAGLRLHLVTDGNEFYYAHLSKFAPGIKPGVKVKAGQLLGYSGEANGVAHLHFGEENGSPVDFMHNNGMDPAAYGQQPSAQPDTAAPSQDPSQPLAQTPDLSLPQYQGPGGPPDPSVSLPQALPPGSVQAGGFSPDQAWQQIASQSLVSPESQLFAQRAQQVLAGGAGAGTS